MEGGGGGGSQLYTDVDQDRARAQRIENGRFTAFEKKNAFDERLFQNGAAAAFEFVRTETDARMRTFTNTTKTKSRTYFTPIE